MVRARFWRSGHNLCSLEKFLVNNEEGHHGGTHLPRYFLGVL